MPFLLGALMSLIVAGGVIPGAKVITDPLIAGVVVGAIVTPLAVAAGVSGTTVILGTTHATTAVIGTTVGVLTAVGVGAYNTIESF